MAARIRPIAIRKRERSKKKTKVGYLHRYPEVVKASDQVLTLLGLFFEQSRFGPGAIKAAKRPFSLSRLVVLSGSMLMSRRLLLPPCFLPNLLPPPLFLYFILFLYLSLSPKVKHGVLQKMDMTYYEIMIQSFGIQ